MDGCMTLSSLHLMMTLGHVQSAINTTTMRRFRGLTTCYHRRRLTSVTHVNTLPVTRPDLMWVSPPTGCSCCCYYRVWSTAEYCWFHKSQSVWNLKRVFVKMLPVTSQPDQLFRDSSMLIVHCFQRWMALCRLMTSHYLSVFLVRHLLCCSLTLLFWHALLGMHSEH